MQRQNTKLRAVNACETVRLQLQDYVTTDATEDEITEWQIDAAIYSAMLSRPDCPESFRQAFTDIFTEHLLKEIIGTTSPDLIELIFPLIVTHLQGWIPADAQRTVSILRTLRETLAPELTTEIQDALDGDGLLVNSIEGDAH
jgi:hypothetical protein